MTATYASRSEILAATAPLAADPARAGAFFDLDGTLAPIVARPEDVVVPPRTRELVERIAREAETTGLHTHRGRMVIELRPPVEVDKGVGITAALGSVPVTGAFYAGDDRTDADAFRALRGMVDQRSLERAVCVAVAADETPAEVIEAADLAVEGPGAFVAVLEALA
jgi:trehalose-phosphatase